VIKSFAFDWLSYIDGTDLVPRFAPRSVAFLPPDYRTLIPQENFELVSGPRPARLGLPIRPLQSSDRALFAINQLYGASEGGIVTNQLCPVDSSE